jgi:hypothetical protein
VGADQFIYYEQFKAHRRVAPDVYVLPGVAPRTAVPSWKTWETGVVPSFAFEVVSEDWEKDYLEAPLAHGALGTQELIVFDPGYDRRRDGARWQRFNRTSDAAFELSERTDEDRIQSKVLGCFLRAHGRQLDLRVRLGSGPNGADLFPTAEEAALARVAELESQLAELKATRER